MQLPVFTSGKARWAGKALVSSEKDSQAYRHAVEEVNQLRTLHVKPLAQTFSQVVKVSSNIEGAIAVQRLKRLSSIEAKLKRKQGQQLSALNDIGGCRLILPNVAMTRDAVGNFNSMQDVVLKAEGGSLDYITEPKNDGYRSHHLICQCKDDIPDSKYCYKIEIQFRSQLQHLWATAVESMGVIKTMQIKEGKGDEDTHEFFRVVSCLFAHEEKEPFVQIANMSYGEIVNRVAALEKRLGIFDRLAGATNAVYVKHLFDAHIKYAPSYYLLASSADTQMLLVWRFEKEDAETAISEYFKQEEEANCDSTSNIVLAFAHSLADIESAYPNYFVKTDEFSEKVKSLLNS